MSLSLARRFRPVTKLGHGPFSRSSRLGVSIIFFAIVFSPRTFRNARSAQGSTVCHHPIELMDPSPSFSWGNAVTPSRQVRTYPKGVHRYTQRGSAPFRQNDETLGARQ